MKRATGMATVKACAAPREHAHQSRIVTLLDLTQGLIFKTACWTPTAIAAAVANSPLVANLTAPTILTIYSTYWSD